MSKPLTAPFPYFGGKRLAVDLVWHALGIECRNYVEPFFGSGAMLLGAPKPLYRRTETVNDLDCMIANFWRAVRAEPEAVARYAANPVIEADLHARHGWLLNQKPALRELMEHPDRYDAKIAGWWVWGMCAGIGGIWCSGDGSWHLTDAGSIEKMDSKGDVEGFRKQIFNSGAIGILSVSIGENRIKAVTDWMIELQGRLREVRVSCGDWSRIMGRSFLELGGLSAVFLDPPYERGNFQYGDGTDRSVAHDVRTWCAANGDNDLLRIALCGHDGDHDELLELGWDKRYWKAQNGYARKSELWKGEAIWFSPHCNKPHGLF